MSTLSTSFCYKLNDVVYKTEVVTTRLEKETAEEFAARHDAELAAAMAGKTIVECA